MKLWKRRSAFPILTKELIEQAARKRTYALRVAYVLVVSLIFLLFIHSMTQRFQGIYGLMGMGHELFMTLTAVQFVAISIVLPAVMSVALTYEKERESLALLLLTDLRPWEILFEKLAGRLIPVLTILLLSLPMMALAYTFGGVTTPQILSSAWFLLLTCLQVGALSLMCSARATSTIGAFLASYISCAALYFGPAALALMRDNTHFDEDAVFVFLPGYVWADTARGGALDAALRSIPILFSIGVFLLLARFWLIRRAFVPRKNRLLAVFRALDRFWTKANTLTGDIILVRDGHKLPQDKPVYWRETCKRSLGRAAYLFRIFILLEVPILFIGLAAADTRSRGDTYSMLVLLVWSFAALLVTVMSANVVPSERTCQTLEVLMSTPLSARDVIRQKMASVGRLVVILSLPLLSLFLMKAFLGSGLVWGRRAEMPPAAYLVASASTLVYLPMFAWVSCWVGMKSRTRAQGVIVSAVVLVLWVLLPIVAFFIADEVLRIRISHHQNLLSFPLLLSPATAVLGAEFNLGHEFFGDLVPSGVIALNFAWHVAILLFFRSLCLMRADRCLRRPPRGMFAGLKSAATGLLRRRETQPWSAR